MEWKFEKPQDIKKFADHISCELMKQSKNEFALEINQFCSTAFTTSSEFLGEFMIIMKKVLSQKDIIFDKGTENGIFKVIETIKIRNRI